MNSQPVTSCIKHLAVSVLSNGTACIKSSCNLIRKCFEVPNVSYTRPLGIIGEYRWSMDKISERIIFTKKKAMLTKDKLNKTINNLPDSFTIDELIDQLIFIEKVEEGLQQSKEAKVVSNEDVKSMIDKWSK